MNLKILREEDVNLTNESKEIVKKKTKLYFIFSQASPIKISEFEYKCLIGQALEINGKFWKKEDRSKLTIKKNTKNIYLQAVADNMIDMSVDDFVKKFSDITNTWESILCQEKRVLEELFFVIHILEKDQICTAEQNINDHLSSWLLNGIMNPKLQNLKKMLKNKKIFFLIFKIPKSQQERGDKGIVVRHIDVHCIM